MNPPASSWWPLLWDSGALALAVLGPDRRYQAVNDACCRLLGSDAATLLSWSYERVGHPFDLDVELEAFVRLANGTPAVSYRRRFRTARGEDFAATVQAIAGSDDTVLQVIIPGAGGQPATSAVHAKRLEQIGSALSHDAQEPVRQLGVSAGVLNERLEPLLSSRERERTLLLGMERNAVRANRHLRALVRFARLGAPVIDPTPCPLRRLVDDARAQVPLDHGVAVQDTVADLSLRCDPAQVTLALTELLRNAVAVHVPGRPTRVTLASEVEDGRVTIVVSDDNVGIAPADLPHVGKLLAASGPGAGAGVGLALVGAVAEAHGGRLDIGSTQGVGTTARLSLPR